MLAFKNIFLLALIPYCTSFKWQPSPVKTKYLDQPLDHFNPKNNETWQMRYNENIEFQKSGGPVFIYMGGEWPISADNLLDSHMFDMAKKLNGSMYYTEHRYLGKSRPREDTSTANLEWLTMEQAMEDMVVFIKYIKEHDSAIRNSKVILIGQSYPGALVTWFRAKHPDLVAGAWASSAAILQKVDDKELKETVSKSMKLVGGEDCANRIQEAFINMEEIVFDKSGNVSRINEEFKLCKPLDSKNDMEVWHFFYQLSDAIAALVQFHTTWQIQSACEKIMNPEKDAIGSFAQWTINEDKLRAWSSKGNDDEYESCYEINYAHEISVLRKVEWSAFANLQMRQWYWLSCNQFAGFQTSTSKNTIFGSSFPVEYFVRKCNDMFDIKLTLSQIEQNVNLVNKMYGGLKPNVTNVYTTQGQLDPFLEGGLQTDLNPLAPAYVIPMATHMADFKSMTTADSPEMQESKKRIYKLVKQWIKS